MIADGFDAGADSAVANAESFAGHAADVGLAARRPVEGDIADDDIVLWHEGGLIGRENDDLAAGQTFADIIVGVTLEGEGHAPGHEGAETLAGAASEMNFDRVFGQTLGSPSPGDLAAYDGADDAVDVADGQHGDNLFLPLDGRLAQFQQDGVVEGFFEAVILG